MSSQVGNYVDWMLLVASFSPTLHPVVFALMHPCSVACNVAVRKQLW